jgi:esterase/lipase superfamily enzyme
MLFITNRFPTGSIRSRAGRRFAFDLKNNAPSNSVYFCERSESGEFTEIMGNPFFARLKTHPCRQLLLYIHGFSNLPEAIFEAAAETQRLCDRQIADEVMVVPMIWPCDDDAGIVKDYWDDQRSADASGQAFARVLSMFDRWRNDLKANPEDDPCLKRINLLSHSMGNRVLRETLCKWDDYDLADGVPMLFRNIFMVAADVVNETLHRGERGEVITHAARNIVVYYASDDLALRASKAANLKNRVASRRLGHTGPENMRKTADNVSAIDCDDVNTKYDLKGHSYFRSDADGNPGKVFEHIFDCIDTGRVALDDSAARRSVIRD